MKTRFEITDELLSINNEIDDAVYKYFVEHYKPHGFIYDDSDGEYYKEFDREIQLNVGDMIYLTEHFTITFKCVDLDHDIITYSVKGQWMY